MFQAAPRYSVHRTVLTTMIGFLISVQSSIAQERPADVNGVKLAPLPALAFDSEVPELTKLTAPQRQKYVEQLKKALDAGSAPKKGALDEAEKYFEAARRLCDADPRLAFAHGLILSRQAKLELAAEQFTNAKQLSRGRLLAADLELIRGQIARSKFDEAAAAVKELSRSLSESRNEPIRSEDERAATHWLGRIAGYLQLAAKTVQNFDGLYSEVSQTLPARLLKDFQSGFEATQSLHAALQSEFEEALAKDRERQEERERSTKANAEEDREGAKSKQQEVGKAADTLTNEVNQKLNNIDSQVAAMRDQYFQLQAESRRLAALMKELEYQEKFEEREKDPQTGKTIVYVRTRTRIRNPGLHRQYSEQRAACQAECARLNQNAQVAAAVKTQTIAAGNQQLNRLQGEAQKLQKEESLAAKRQRNAEKQIEKDSVDRTGKTSLLETRLHRLDTYLPVSPAESRRLLLKSFEP